jgi:predicted dehydrogenase
VVVGTPTNLHRDVIVAAAQAGKHIFTEKVLAATLHECNEILDAVKQAGVILMVSMPRLYAGYTYAVKEVIEQGVLGQLTTVRVRVAHNGALSTASDPDGWLPKHFYNYDQALGGAMIDLGCHPMYLTRYFLGMPESVTGHYGYVTGREVEDNAVAVLSYPNGALGIAEVSFTNAYAPFTIEIHGTQGSLLYGTPESKLTIRIASLPNKQWIVRQDMPGDQPSPFEQWVAHVQNGTWADTNVQIAIDLTKLMEASNLSAKMKQPVYLDSLNS